jgi:hypothetical protein
VVSEHASEQSSRCQGISGEELSGCISRRHAVEIMIEPSER